MEVMHNLMNRKNIYIGIGAVILLALVAAGAWAALYTYDRFQKIQHNVACDRLGKPVPTSCVYEIVPPTLWEKLTGHRLGERPAYPISEGCDQSATTTDCSKLVSLPQTTPPPYVPPNPVQPTETWTSATDAPISLFGFSFELPVGWHGSVYNDAYLQNLHALVQSDSSDRGFTIDCPPAGKGLESATRLSSEERSFTADGTDYSVAFEKWTAPGNDPWYFVWVRMPQSGDSSNGSSGTYCLAQGTATPDIEEAMRALYESWK